MYKALKKIVGNYDNVKNYDHIICTFVGSGCPYEQCSISTDVLCPRCSVTVYIESSLCIFVGSCGPHEQCSISSDVLSPRCRGSNNSDNAPRRLLKVVIFLMKLIKPYIQSLC